MRPVALLLLWSSLAFGSESLQLSQFETITFKGIPPTKYSNQGDVLVADVNQSSSILLKAYDKVRKVKNIQVDWQSEGKLNLVNPQAEKTKSGDDARFRVGLIVSGEAPLVPFFAPAWIKKTRDILKLPSNLMIYLSLGSLSAPGSRWNSPYSDSILSIATPSKPLKDGWQRATINLEKPYDIVGLWLFADGDNSKSQFTTKIKDLKLSL